MRLSVALHHLPRIAGLAALGASGLTMPAHAQSVTLTDDSGRPLVVGGASALGSGLAGPATTNAAEIVAEFQRLCLPDPAGAGARAAASSLALAPADAVFPAEGKQPEARVAQWRGRSASLSVFTGDDAGLKKRAIAITSRAYVTTGPYGPFKAAGTQCNLVVSLPDFAAATDVSGALSAAFGTPGKLVVKKTFADGYWSAAAGTRINFTAPTTSGGPQPVHLSAQILEKDSNR